MKIKITLLTALFLLFSFTGFTQTYKDNIERDFNHLNELMLAGQIEKALELFPKKIFEVVSKEQLIAVFNQLLNNKDFKMAILDSKVLNVSAPEKIDSCYYSAVKYVSTVTMEFTPPENEVDEARTSRLQGIMLSLSNSFGSDKVTLNESTGLFKITPLKKTYAISNNGQSGWQFVNVEPTQRVIMEKLLPKQILDRELN